MGWFSNLFTNDAVSRAVTFQDDTHKVEPYSVVRAKITSGAIHEQIKLLRDLLIKLPIHSSHRSKYLRSAGATYYGPSTNRPYPHRAKVDNLLNLLSTSLKTVDVERADMKTLFRVIDLCNSTLPALFRNMEIRIGQDDWTTEIETLKKMEELLEAILAEVGLLPTNRSILHIDFVEDSNGKEFPPIEPYTEHPELYAALEALKNDWDKAVQLPLTNEDDYVIERVGNSYLPDALLLFDRFCHRTGATNSKKALSIVQEQVRLIHEQVSYVLEQHEEDSFDMMETHTEFLKMKNSRIGIDSKDAPQLKLDNMPSEGDS